MPRPDYDYLQQHPLISIINVNWGIADVGIFELGMKGASVPPPTNEAHRMAIFAFAPRPGDYELQDFDYPFAPAPVDPHAFSWVGALEANFAAAPDPVLGGWHNFYLYRRFDPYSAQYDWEPEAIPAVGGPGAGIPPWVYDPSLHGGAESGEVRTALVPDPAHYNLAPPDARNFWNNYVWAVGFIKGRNHNNNDTFIMNFKKMRDDWKSGVINSENPVTPENPRLPLTDERTGCVQFRWGTNFDWSQDPNPPSTTGRLQFRFRAYRGTGGQFVLQKPTSVADPGGTEDGGVDYINRGLNTVGKVFETVRDYPITDIIMLGAARYNMRTKFTLTTGGGASFAEFPLPPPFPPSTLLRTTVREEAASGVVVRVPESA